jgi:alpha-ketoglutaric semialdehyde dehydrogenase
MSSVNPVILLPQALALRGAAIGEAFVASLALGAGQFCTNPGLLLALDGEALNAFVESVRDRLSGVSAATMLSPGIHKAYDDGVAALTAHAATDLLARGSRGGGFQGQAALFATTAAQFLEHPALREEVFGASSLLVRCQDIEALIAVIDSLDGQLTAAVHADDGDADLSGRLLPRLERRAGRILFNGFGTGVEVSHAMVHGGPYPATSDPRTTSVGALAIMRFLRPVCYQDMPAGLLPAVLRDDNPCKLPRRIDGVLQVGA